MPLVSKKRGGLGKHGNMFHNDKAYTDWKACFAIRAQMLGLTAEKIDGFVGLIYDLDYVRKRGHLPDVGNTLGMIEDSLVCGKFIVDDNRDQISTYSVFSQDAAKEGFTIYFCHTWDEYVAKFLEISMGKREYPRMKNIIKV